MDCFFAFFFVFIEIPMAHSPEINAFVVSVFPAAHVAMIANDFPQMFRRHVLFLSVHETKFSLFGETFVLQLLPLLS